MARTHYDGQRDLSNALLDRNARLMRIQAMLEREIAFTAQLTALAAREEAALRRNGNPERMARMLATDGQTSEQALE